MINNPHYLFTRLLEKILQRPPSASRRHKCFFVACFPKSGSTYLRNLLVNIANCTGVSFAATEPHRWQNEQDISTVRVGQCQKMNIVVQQHVKGTENNVHVLKQYGIKPVVLVRDIFDIVLSIRDHFVRESIKNPTGYVHQGYLEMDEEEQLIFIARIHIPWYFNFLVSWEEASTRIDTFWTSYEELFADPEATVTRILDFQDFSADTNQIRLSIEAMSEVDTRRNKGVSGRGQALPDDCKQAILQIAECWKLDNDILGRIGLQADAKGNVTHLMHQGEDI